MKKIATLLGGLTVCVGQVFAASPNWIKTGGDGKGSLEVDANSIRVRTDGSMAFWERSVFPSAQADGTASAEQHVVVSCDGAASYLADAFVTRDLDGKILISTAKASEYPLSPGSIQDAAVDRVCAVKTALRKASK